LNLKDNSQPSEKKWLLTKSTIDIPEKPEEDEKNKDGGQTTTAEFPGAGAGKYGSQTFIHSMMFLLKG
jgi:hypothetical protein